MTGRVGACTNLVQTDRQLSFWRMTWIWSRGQQLKPGYDPKREQVLTKAKRGKAKIYRLQRGPQRNCPAQAPTHYKAEIGQ